MKSVIITPENKKDLKLLLQLAQRLGCMVRVLSEEEIEEIEDSWLLKAMEEGRTGKYDSLEEVKKALKS